MDNQDQASANCQRAQQVRLVQVVEHNSRPSTLWELITTGRAEQTTTRYSVVPMLR